MIPEREQDNPGHRDFWLDAFVQVETTRHLARVAMVLGLKIVAAGNPPTIARFMRQGMTAGIPELLAGAERAGIPAHELSTAAIEDWARRVHRDDETRIVLDGPWNYQEDLPQWRVDGTTFDEQVLGNRQG